MSAVVDSDARRAECLRRALRINPNNAAARKGLVRLEAKRQAETVSPAVPPAQGQPVVNRSSEMPERVRVPQTASPLPAPSQTPSVSLPPALPMDSQPKQADPGGAGSGKKKDHVSPLVWTVASLLVL